MPVPIVDQVIDFYYALYEHIFAAPFQSRIADRLRRDAVVRQVQESAGAASQSLTRFFRNQQLTEQQTAALLSVSRLSTSKRASHRIMRLGQNLPCSPADWQNASQG